jgi:hypothetical protein
LPAKRSKILEHPESTEYAGFVESLQGKGVTLPELSHLLTVELQKDILLNKY